MVAAWNARSPSSMTARGRSLVMKTSRLVRGSPSGQAVEFDRRVHQMPHRVDRHRTIVPFQIQNAFDPQQIFTA